MKFSVILLAGILAAVSATVSAATEKPPVTIKAVTSFYNPNAPFSPYTQSLIELMRKEPDIRLNHWGGIALPAGLQASLMMSLAGGTAPDIGLSWFHTVGNDIRQGFLYPLNEWIGEDKNGNGILDDDEIIWPEWKKYRPLWRQVVSSNGKIYGIPLPITGVEGIIFRTDMVKAAGLDPNNPPRDWDEFYEWCKKLTEPGRKVKGAVIQQGQCGFLMPQEPHQFLLWVHAAGGSPFVQSKKSPVSGRVYEFAMDADNFTTPEGENLIARPSEWRADWDTEEGRLAIDFFYKLRWGKWDDEGRKVTGVARIATGQRGGNAFELLGNGEVAMIMSAVDELDAVGSDAKIDPSLLSWFPVPAAPGPRGRQVVQIYQHYAVMYAGVGERPRAERDAVWRALLAVTSPEVLNSSVQSKALAGMSRFVSPDHLRRLGYDEYIREIPLTIQQNFENIEKNEVLSKTEPYAGAWLVIFQAFQRQLFGIMLGANGENFDYRKAFSELQVQANSGLMFDMPREELDKYRTFARVVVAIIILIMGVLVYKIIVSGRVKQRAVNKSVYSGWLPVVLLLPALLIITCWNYYPLLRGMVMAVQDYKIIGESRFIGLDNFIVLALDKTFWVSILRTFYFVFLNMVFAFLAPIFLAVLLTEAPRGKIFFRTLFFLPQMTSGLVIALMWKLMYNPTPAGFFNQLLAYLNYLPGVNISPQTWLEDPRLAMICCIVPTVWAGMGMGSLIYLAALQSLPKELYEAAEIDGAGFFKKFIKITVPYLLPLIIINFVGTFIATFQGMGNIFLMTFGGPGDATMVVGMKIWLEAYVNLRFSMATCMAWVMGAGLIGLTYIQIQFLKRVEYKRASD